MKDFNDSKEEKLFNSCEKVFSFLGYDISEDGIVTTKNWISRFMSDLLVREGKWVKIETNKYKSKD